MCCTLQTVAILQRILHKTEVAGYGLEVSALGNRQSCLYFSGFEYYFLVLTSIPLSSAPLHKDSIVGVLHLPQWRALLVEVLWYNLSLVLDEYRF